MLWTDLFREGFYAQFRNLLRTLLSLIGIIFGVGALVAMMAIGLGAKEEIQNILNRLGAKNIIIQTKPVSKADIYSTRGVSNRDIRALKTLPGRPMVTALARWKTQDSNHPIGGDFLSIYGVDHNIWHILNLQLLGGRYFSMTDHQYSLPVAIIGHKLADKWFEKPGDAVGQSLRINYTWFTIIGVVRESLIKKQQSLSKQEKLLEMQKISDFSGVILVPQSSGESRIGPLFLVSPIEKIFIQAPASFEPLKYKIFIERILHRLHKGLSPYTIKTAVEMIAQQQKTSQTFSIFLMIVAVISLVVGGIGIVNVMIAAKVERIREIGLRRALGAKKKDIFQQFLFESISICLAGGVLGVFLGLFASYMISSFTNWSSTYSWWSFAVAIGASSFVGIIAGIYPAISASKISPMVALRS